MGKQPVTDICYVVSFGFAARMLLQTGLLVKVLEQGKSVAIITPDPDNENFRALLCFSGFSLHGPGAAAHGMWHDNYLFKRKYYLEDIRANPALWEKHVYSLRYSKSLHPWRRIRPLYYLLIYYLIKVFPGIRRSFLAREERYLRSEAITELLTQINPRLVVATYPVNILEAQVLYAAKRAAIPTLLQLLSWDNITSKGRFPVVADWYILWGPVMQEELEAHYQIAPERVFRCGVPHFDHYEAFRARSAHTSYLEQLDLDATRPYLFFAMSAERFAPREIDIVEQLAQAIRNNAFGADLQLVVRPHPQVVSGNMTSNSWLARLQQLNGDRVAIDWPRLLKSKLRWSMHQADMDQLAALLSGCKLCLNSGSTISIEALLLDKPVVLTSFDAADKLPYWQSARRLLDYVHLRKLVEQGGVTVTYNKDEMEQAIARYLAEPDHLIAARQATIARQCHQADGQATERVVAALMTILVKLVK